MKINKYKADVLSKILKNFSWKYFLGFKLNLSFKNLKTKIDKKLKITIPAKIISKNVLSSIFGKKLEAKVKAVRYEKRIVIMEATNRIIRFSRILLHAISVWDQPSFFPNTFLKTNSITLPGKYFAIFAFTYTMYISLKVTLTSPLFINSIIIFQANGNKEKKHAYTKDNIRIIPHAFKGELIFREVKFILYIEIPIYKKDKIVKI